MEILDIKKRVDEFCLENEENLENIFNQLSLFLFSLDSKDHDLYFLAKILPHEYLIELIQYYDGDVIRFPKMSEFINCYLVTICFFLSEELKWDWGKIKTYLKLNNKDEEFSSISVGKQIIKLKNSFNKDLIYLIKKHLSENVNDEEIDKAIKKVLKWKKKN